jgi:hypothetical protein
LFAEIVAFGLGLEPVGVSVAASVIKTLAFSGFLVEVEAWNQSFTQSGFCWQGADNGSGLA